MPGAPSVARLDEWIDAHRDELTGLAADLVRFDTQAVDPGPAQRENDEAACQAFLREWLDDAGLVAESVRPDPAAFAEHPMMTPGHHWEGRDMTLARLAGADSAGRTLAVNGHIDVVNAGPLDTWTVDPFGGAVADGRLWGRGAADMKGGLAAACLALKALAATRTQLAGDLWLQVVTDEETNGMGTVAMLAHAPPADAAICPEPTGFDAWVACRGVLYARLTIAGRAGHAEGHQQHWQAGGGVSAIEKLGVVLGAIERINSEWQLRRDKRHRTLSRPRIVPTVVSGGDFIASYPARCTLEVDITYLPADADDTGFGSRVREEVESELAHAVAADRWMRAHPVEWTWLMDYPPYEPADVEELCGTLDQAVAPLHRVVRRRGLDSWHDAASIGLRHGVPAVSFGPGDPRQAHVADEFIEIQDLIDGAKVLARAFAHWCGLAAAIDPDDFWGAAPRLTGSGR